MYLVVAVVLVPDGQKVFPRADCHADAHHVGLLEHLPDHREHKVLQAPSRIRSRHFVQYVTAMYLFHAKIYVEYRSTSRYLVFQRTTKAYVEVTVQNPSKMADSLR